MSAGTKAVAIYSGGLDSTLAIITMLRQGVDVTAVTFLTQFGCDTGDRSSCSKDPFSASVKFGFEVKLSHLAGKFVDIVKNPKFGHGKNMNPCIDCRILMLREAKELMEILGAGFIITGEVLGQRPMSQRRETFPLIDRESGLKGRVLRPLSAKLLKPTVPEEEGLVDRERLYAISGRTRKPQMALAAEFGLTDYPNPAGGCLLTEPNYSYRLRDLLEHEPELEAGDLSLLRVGRRFRLGPRAITVVGRNEAENEAIMALRDASADPVMRVDGVGSPTVLLKGVYTDRDLRTAASLCARYSDAKHEPVVEVTCRLPIPAGVDSGCGAELKLSVKPAAEETLSALRIEAPAGGKKKKRTAKEKAL